MFGRKIVLAVLFILVAGDDLQDSPRHQERVSNQRQGFPKSKSFQRQEGVLLMKSAQKSGLLPPDSLVLALPHAFTTFVSPVGEEDLTLRQFLSRYRDDKSIYLDQPIISTFKTTFLEDNHLKANCTEEVFSRRFKKEHLKKLQQWDTECQDVTNELFQQMDINKDRILSSEDVENVNPEGMRHLAGILEDRLADIADIADDQEDEKPKKKKGPVEMAAGMAVDYEKELQAILEEGFNEILKETNIKGKVSFDKDGLPKVTKTAEEREDKDGATKATKTPKEKDSANKKPATKEEL